MTEKTKHVDHVRESVISQAQNKPVVKPKEGKSTFDKLLEENMFKQTTGVQTAAQDKGLATEQAIRQSQSHDQRGKDKEKERDEKSSQGKSDQRADGKEASHQRVQAKGSLKDQQGEGGHGQSKEGRSFAGGRKSPEALRKLEADKRLSLAKAGGEDGFALQFKVALKEAVGTKKLDQEVINQVVQFVKISKNEKGEKEMELQFRDKVFKGLRLKVAAVGNGKVNVHFLSSDDETKSIFEAGKDDILKALSRQGIEVEEFLVS